MDTDKLNPELQLTLKLALDHYRRQIQRLAQETPIASIRNAYHVQLDYIHQLQRDKFFSPYTGDRNAPTETKTDQQTA